ncbi:cupin [Congregibacter brevis]|uniref:Cupin n=1 Tax=Congregibacter brevis TaxID=3081201 RepID=A0ABZ0IEX8_9GAMM|nr:cupin [Congregibacter sp. IMCC45268]
MSRITSVQNLKNTYAVMQPDMSLALEEVCPELYPSLDENYNGFKNHSLVACHEFDADWGSWEMHPAGDELVVLMSGRVTMILLNGETETSLSLEEPGSYVVVPKGLWHTALIAEPTKMLFMTPGEGTLHAEVPPKP